MLSDREREVLDDIQRRLLVEDPGFQRSFEAGACRLERRRRGHRRWAYSGAIALIAMLGVLMWVAGSPNIALVLAAMAGVIWEARRRSDITTPQTR